MNIFGLVGYPLSHSFSQKYFKEKFEREQISNSRYEMFELKKIEEIQTLLAGKELKGFNVTIPYKEAIIPYLDKLHSSALKVGAVNVVKREADHTWVGYNSDFYGFKTSLENWLPHLSCKAVVLGTGGASKAVIAALKDLTIPYRVISRKPGQHQHTYEALKTSDILTSHTLIINTTPLGTYPDINTCPDIDYHQLTSSHYLYDLVYNPAITSFMQKGSDQGSLAKNGLEMLELQAEKSWDIWHTAG